MLELLVCEELQLLKSSKKNSKFLLVSCRQQSASSLLLPRREPDDCCPVLSWPWAVLAIGKVGIEADFRL